ncbi:MAG: PAS domain S-box protein [Bacteroidetes bacterium]|nr:PAS domain S-box protein [Bacteroidota bacterium]
MNQTSLLASTIEVENLHIQSNSQKELERSEKEFKALFDQSNDGIIIVRGGVFTDCNNRIVEMFGYPKEEFIKNTPLDLSPDYQPSGRKSLDGISAKVQAAMAGEVQNFYWQHKRRNGELFDTDVTVCRFDIEEDIYLQIIVRDITELISTKDALANKVKELEHYIASNNELEQFAHATAHDLKEPLRTVQNFAQLLKVAEADNLKEGSKEFMGYIISGVESMSKLIQDLLEYSKVSAQTEQALENVNIGHTLNLIQVQNLRKLIEETNAKITVVNLPETIVAVRPKMAQLFQNLLNNALKFRSKDRIPEVIIEAKDHEKYWLFEVSDNGIGINEDNLSKIFEVFTRLHSKAEYEGSGIGLATCQKIVKQHGGRIWASSRLGDGTVFSFTIPK